MPYSGQKKWAVGTLGNLGVMIASAHPSMTHRPLRTVLCCTVPYRIIALHPHATEITAAGSSSYPTVVWTLNSLLLSLHCLYHLYLLLLRSRKSHHAWYAMMPSSVDGFFIRKKWEQSCCLAAFLVLQQNLSVCVPLAFCIIFVIRTFQAFHQTDIHHFGQKNKKQGRPSNSTQKHNYL